MKLKPGDTVPATTMDAVTGDAIHLSGGRGLVHLQFRRFVDCPICNTHIAEFRKRAKEIEAAGITEAIVFHSSPTSIRSHQKDVPFSMIGDPKKALYRKFGVETSLAFVSPKALGAALRGMAHGHFALRFAGGGPFGLPADFLIAPTGRIAAVKYGADAYDQWSVDELLTLAKAVSAKVV